jgi:hypothetical protein
VRRPALSPNFAMLTPQFLAVGFGKNRRLYWQTEQQPEA